jgi:hypothetical protein
MALLTVSLASVYLTYVVTKSEFPAILWTRAKVFQRWGNGSWQAYLATCAWCAASYVAGLTVLVTAWTVGLPVPVLVWLAAAGLAGVLLELVETMWAVQRDSN